MASPKGQPTRSVELCFYEDLCRLDAENWEARRLLADAYTRCGFWAEGLQQDLDLVSHFPDDPLVFFNLACSYSRCAQIANALQALSRAVQLGYEDWDWLLEDDDLEAVRSSEEFTHWLAEHRKFFHQPEP